MLRTRLILGLICFYITLTSSALAIEPCTAVAAFELELQQDSVFVYDQSNGSSEQTQWYLDDEKVENPYVSYQVDTGWHQLCQKVYGDGCYDVSCQEFYREPWSGEKCPAIIDLSYDLTTKGSFLFTASASKDTEGFQWYVNGEFAGKGMELDTLPKEASEICVIGWHAASGCFNEQCMTFNPAENCLFKTNWAYSSNKDTAIFWLTDPYKNASVMWSYTAPYPTTDQLYPGDSLFIPLLVNGAYQTCAYVSSNNCDTALCLSISVDHIPDPCGDSISIQFAAKDDSSILLWTPPLNPTFSSCSWNINEETYNSCELTFTPTYRGEHAICYTSNHLSGCKVSVCDTLTFPMIDTSSVLILGGMVEGFEMGNTVRCILFEQIDSTTYQPLDTVYSLSGEYQFPVTAGVYMVKSQTAEDNSGALNAWKEGYYGDAWLWSQATSIVMSTVHSMNNDISIHDLSNDLTTGAGKIKGRINDIVGFKTQNVAVQGVAVYLIYNESVIARSETDDLGFYEFVHVPAGEYEVMVDWMGQTPVAVSVELAEGEQLENVDFERAQPVSISGLFDPKSQNVALQLYPQPAQDAVTLSLPIGMNALNISNAAGQIIVSKSWSTGVPTARLSVEQLPPGLYWIQVRGANTPWIGKKLVVQ